MGNAHQPGGPHLRTWQGIWDGSDNQFIQPSALDWGSSYYTPIRKGVDVAQGELHQSVSKRIEIMNRISSFMEDVPFEQLTKLVEFAEQAEEEPPSSSSGITLNGWPEDDEWMKGHCWEILNDRLNPPSPEIRKWVPDDYTGGNWRFWGNSLKGWFGGASSDTMRHAVSGEATVRPINDPSK